MAANENNPTTACVTALLLFAPFLPFGGLYLEQPNIFCLVVDKRIAKKEQEEFTRENSKNCHFFATMGTSDSHDADPWSDYM